MVERVKLSDRRLRALKPAPAGSRYELMDTEVSGFGVRVSETGKVTFMLLARYPGSSNPTRRALGEYPTDSLAEAREKAREWRKWIERGKDPKLEEEGRRLAELRKQADTFDAVAEAYIKRVLPHQRRGTIVAGEIERELCARWKGRPITSIDRQDVLQVVNDAVDRGAPHQARNLLGHVRALFNWAIEIGNYGLETSPCDRIRPKHVIGERAPRDRVLNDTELRALWKSALAIGYPYGSIVQLLLLTGVRKTEASGAQWSEFDLYREEMWTLEKQPLWTIPAERFKAKSNHLVPLADEAVELLRDIPRRTRGDYVFSTTGSAPWAGFARAKNSIDKLMQEELGVALAPWRLHDIRRTVRTRLASLRVADEVAEMVIGHGRKGIQRVYDQHTYLPEMREALELWSAWLHAIVTPPPDNLIKLRTEKA